MWYDSLKIGTERKVNGWYLTDSWLQLEQVTWEDKSGSKHKLMEMHLRNDSGTRRARERSSAKQSKYPRNFGSHVAVRPSVRPHHRASDVKCHTLSLMSSVGACNLILHIHVLVNWHPLTSITWLYPGFRCRHIEVASFFMLSADKLLFFN